MERFTARKTQPAAQKPAATQQNPAAAGAVNNESFSDMANITAAKSGLVGKLLVVSLIVVSLAITLFVGFAIIRGVSGGDSIKSDQYQAVFLTDGQIYFGKLTGLNEEYAVLEDIYYLQVEQQVQPDRAEEAASNISLAKLGNELHGPEDEMFINSDQILFWENLKDDGQVVTAINNFVSSGAAEQAPAAQQPQTAPATSAPAPADTTEEAEEPADTDTAN